MGSTAVVDEMGATFAADLAKDLAMVEEEELIREALGARSSLREVSKQVERELRAVETSSVRDYVRQSSQVADLHNEMTRCDAILGKMEEMLVGFETALGSASQEIRELQRESRRMSAKLRNRRAAEAGLSSFLESLALAPSTPGVICEGEVDDEFLERVKELDSRLSFAANGQRAKGGSRRAVAELWPALDRLKLKACGRARDYLVERVGELRKLQTNVEMLQRTQLLRFAALYAFLERHAPEAATEVRDFYLESMAKALQSLFKAYNAALLKFDLEVANKFDLVAVDESAVRSAFTSRVNLSKRGDGFSLGDRIEVLSRLDAPPILSHVAMAEDKRYPFEELFRSAVRHLLDAVASETRFVTEFFFPTTHDASTLAAWKRVDALVSKIFGKAASAALEALENKLFQCHDAVGLLLVARLVDAARAQATKRAPHHLPTLLAHFFDHCDALVAPRLAAILRANVDSAKRADPARLGVSSVMPHYAARRYAELAAAVLALFPDDDRRHAPLVRRHLADLRAELVDLLRRIANSFRHDKDKLTFLINNYDHVLTIFRERRVDAPRDLDHFEAKLRKDREDFVELELRQPFHKLIDFVNHTEKLYPADLPHHAPDAANSPSLKLDAALVQTLVRDFAATWKTAIDKIHRDILASFANFLNGMEVLKQVLTQLLLYYTRFQKIVQRAWRRPPAFANDLVPTAVIFEEIRKYSHSF